MVSRHLTLIRHAKSSWADPSLEDSERPLNGRGLRAAPMMARRARDLGWKPDLLLCSSAARTRETAGLFLEVFQLPESLLEVSPGLYNAPPGAIFQAIRGLSSDRMDVLVFAHNPGLELLAGELACTPLHFPTCAVARFSCSAPSWRACEAAHFTLVHHDFPNNPSFED